MLLLRRALFTLCVTFLVSGNKYRLFLVGSNAFQQHHHVVVHNNNNNNNIYHNHRMVPFSLFASTGKGEATAVTIVKKDDEEWKELLNEEQYYVLRDDGTEAPWASPLNEVKEDGTFSCVGCGSPLFQTKTKFESGSGWPSFYRPIDNNAVDLRADFTMMIMRTEARCAACNGHLGHVFEDGPQPTGQRYCMNGVAMSFTSDSEDPELANIVKEREQEVPMKSPVLAIFSSLLTDAGVATLFWASFLKSGGTDHLMTVLSEGAKNPVGIIFEILPIVVGLYYTFTATQKIVRLVPSQESEYNL